MANRDVDGSFDVRLILKEMIDREVKDFYQVKIYAIDGGSLALTSSITVDIIVTDINDNRPEFERALYEVEISENVHPRKHLVKVKATDSDVGENGRVKYRFSSKTSAQYGRMFAIDADSGHVTMLRSIDYEDEEFDQKVISLEVLAQDEGEGSSPVMTRISVSVKDVNDNAPRIELDTSLAGGSGGGGGGAGGGGGESSTESVLHMVEHTANHSLIAQVYVSDRDSGEGGRVDCQLQLINGVSTKHSV